MSALALVMGEQIESEQELLDFAIRREQAFWDEGISEAGAPALRGRPIAQAAAVATLAGRVADLQQAMQLMAHAPLLKGQPVAVLEAAAELFHRLYPGQAWLEGVQPDILGEHLIGHSLETDPALIQVFSHHG
jgi:hypothetical protein